MELTALAHGRANESGLISLAHLDGEDGDTLHKDEEIELLVDDVFKELEYRNAACGAAYPFQIGDKGNVLNITGNSPLSDSQYTYVFCLIASDYRRKQLIGSSVYPPGHPSVDELLQICSTIAAAGLVKGPSVSFGFPRPDHSGFLAALNTVYVSGMKEAQPIPQVQPGLSPHPKDRGIDIIAWRHFPDQLPGKLYLLGQCASGKGFPEKGIKSILNSFHNDWFTSSPASPPIDSIFIPFTLDETLPVNEKFSREANRSGYYLSQTRNLGIIVDRCRLSALIAPGMEFASEHPLCVDRIEDLPQVRAWVDNIRATLTNYA